MIPNYINYSNTVESGKGKTKVFNIDLSGNGLKTTTIQKAINNAVNGNVSVCILHNNRKLRTPVENIVIPPNNSNTLITTFLITKELIDNSIYTDDSDGKECVDIPLNSPEDEVKFVSYKNRITKCDQYLRVKFSSRYSIYRSEIKTVSRMNTFLTTDTISSMDGSTGCFKPTYRYQAASKGYVDDIVTKSITLNESGGYTAVAGRAPTLCINGGVCAVYGQVQKTVNACSTSGAYLFDIPYSIPKSSYSIPIFYNVSGIGDKTSRMGLLSIMNRSSSYSECYLHYSSTGGSYNFGVEGSVCTVILDGITFMINNR